MSRKLARLFDVNFLKQKPFLFSRAEEDSRDKGKLYKPQTKHEDKSVEKMTEYTKTLSSPAPGSTSKKDISKKVPKAYEKKKSNLELFKEELRQ